MRQSGASGRPERPESSRDRADSRGFQAGSRDRHSRPFPAAGRTPRAGLVFGAVLFLASLFLLPRHALGRGLEDASAPMAATDGVAVDAVPADDSTSDTLSQQEWSWIEQAWEGGASDRRVVIGGIRTEGISEDLREFVLWHLPVRSGDAMEESDLERVIHRHNREAAARTDLWESYAVHVLGHGEDSARELLVSARPYAVGTYHGGAAYAYVGNHNRTGRGDRWGAWIGYNVQGAEWDAYLARGWYLGAVARRSFPLSPSSDLADLREWSIAARARHAASLSTEIDLDAGVVAVFPSAAARTAGATSDVRPFVRPTLIVDPPGLRADGASLFRAELSARLARSLDQRREALSLSLRSMHRMPIWRMLGQATFFRLERIFLRFDGQEEMTDAFGRRELARRDPSMDLAATLESQTRIQLLSRQVGFTRMDAGTMAFLEGVATAGSARQSRATWGGGVFAGFTAPVGVDFQFQWGSGTAGAPAFRFLAASYL